MCVTLRGICLFSTFFLCKIVRRSDKFHFSVYEVAKKKKVGPIGTMRSVAFLLHAIIKMNHSPPCFFLWTYIKDQYFLVSFFLILQLPLPFFLKKSLV